jgi:hypothetical protein
MKFFKESLLRLLRFAFRLALIAAGLIFMASLLVVVLLMLVVALITGKKPNVSMQWSRYGRWRSRSPWPPRTTPRAQNGVVDAEVIDVQGREVKAAPGALPKE